MANLVELFDNIVQMQNLNGVPLANGKMYVYALGRTRLMDTWSDVDGESLNSNPIILDAAGQCHCYVSDDFDYTIVVTDAYDNEIFSIDKYLYSKGSHSHADVAVAPSETIAVSSYHVGETTVYVPYLTGQLGKVYEGVEPIVVNNTEDKISANHVPLGVQDPLYFVQDDEEGCILGCSAQTEIPAELSGKWDEASDVVIANSAQWAEGTEYEAGSYISIDGNTLNVTGLTPVPADTASTGLVASVSADIVSLIPSTAGLATTAQLDEKLDKADSANFYPMNSNPSGYISELPSDLATTGWVDSQGYLTAVDIPESANWNSTYNTVSANSAQWAGGTANPQIPVTGINGIKISESGDQVVFEVSGDYYTNDNPSGFITGVPADMATTGDIADLAQSISETYQTAGNYQTAGDYYSASNPSGFITGVDLTPYQTVEGMTAYQPVGEYYSASNPSGFITGVDLSDYATTAQLADKQDITGMTAYQPVGNYQTAGDYLTTADSANFYTTANESGFITGVDLTPYQTTAGMTAYQEAGDYYSASNPSGFLTAHQSLEGYLQDSDLGITDNKITAISGVELSAGGDVPEGVMVESGIEYNSQGYINGYSGSAIATIDQERQWFTHDDTLCHVSNSAQYALGINMSAISADLARMMGVDETLLWSGSMNTTATSGTLLESLENFNKAKIYTRVVNSTDRASIITTVEPRFGASDYTLMYFPNYSIGGGTTTQNVMYLQAFSDKTMKLLAGSKWVNGTYTQSITAYDFTITAIYGIGRKS